MAPEALHMATAARSFSSFCLSMALYSTGSTTAPEAAAAAVCFTCAAPPPLAPAIGVGSAAGLSSTASSRNFWKHHSDGHRFIAPSAPPPPAAAGRGDGWPQKGSGISSTEKTRSMRPESAVRTFLIPNRGAGRARLRRAGIPRGRGGFEGLIGNFSPSGRCRVSRLGAEGRGETGSGREEEEKKKRGCLPVSELCCCSTSSAGWPDLGTLINPKFPNPPPWPVCCKARTLLLHHHTSSSTYTRRSESTTAQPTLDNDEQGATDCAFHRCGSHASPLRAGPKPS